MKSRRRFLWPWKIGLHKGRENFGIIANEKHHAFYLIIHEPHRMTGTMDTTTYYFDLKWRGKHYQWSFCWRPDVTHYWWFREPRIKKHRGNEKCQKKKKPHIA